MNQEEIVKKTIKPALEFLEMIKSGNKVVIIHAHDNDSISSAAVMYRLIMRKFKMKPFLVSSGMNFSVTDDVFKKLKEIKPDFVIIVDIAQISKEIENKLNEYKVLSIDHHGPFEYEKIIYSNPRLFKKDIYLPASYICYKIYEHYYKSDEVSWVAGIGVLGDHGVTQCLDLFEKIKKNYPELVDDIEFIDEKLFDYSLIGKLTKIFDSARVVEGRYGAEVGAKVLTKNFSNKDPDVKKLLAWHEITNKEFKRLVSLFYKKREGVGKNILFFMFNSKLSIKSSIAGYLPQFFGDKILIVGQKEKGMYDFSFRRGPKVKTNLRDVVKKSIQDIPNATGGGHEAASAARIEVKYFEKFMKNLEHI